MASENETVEDIVREFKNKANYPNVGSDGLVIEISQEEIWDACDRIEAAHGREVAELRECLKEAVFVMQTLFDKQMSKWLKAMKGGEK